MFSADFDYFRANSVAEAGELLAKHPNAKLLAGGHSLIPLLKLRLATPETVIDIGRIADLHGITINDQLTIGALSTHADIASSTDVQQHATALADAASQVGDPAVRNRGTIGGNIAHADPASDLPTVLVSLGATLTVVGPAGKRSVDVAEFFQGVMMTTLGDNDLITSIQIPMASADQVTAYAKFSHPASRYAVIGVAVARTVNNGTCSAASVAIGGLVPIPTQCRAVEDILRDQSLSSATIATAASAVTNDLGDDLLGDVFASADYRKAIANVYVRRALTTAAERVK